MRCLVCFRWLSFLVTAATAAVAAAAAAATATLTPSTRTSTTAALLVPKSALTPHYLHHATGVAPATFRPCREVRRRGVVLFRRRPLLARPSSLVSAGSWSLNAASDAAMTAEMGSSRSSSSSLPLPSNDDSDDPRPLRYVSGLGDIADVHSSFILDMWGVMHDGTAPYPHAVETVRKLKHAGKKLVILSNSSKRTDHTHKMLTKLGFDVADFDGIITSGEVSHAMLSGRRCDGNRLGGGGGGDGGGDGSTGTDGTAATATTGWPILDDLLETPNRRNVFVFGSGDGDVGYCSSAGWTVSPIESADLIVARGTFTIHCVHVNNGDDHSDVKNVVVHKKDNEDTYFRILDEVLTSAARRSVPMLVTNPDRVRPDVGLPPMPGAIGDAYEAKLSAISGVDASSLVRRIGKPYQDVYDLAFRSLGLDGAYDNDAGNEGTNGETRKIGEAKEEERMKDRRSVCMVGDALETDVLGGADALCSTLWVVLNGIHGPAIVEAEKEQLMGETNTNTKSTTERSTGSESEGRSIPPLYERGAESVLNRFNSNNKTPKCDAHADKEENSKGKSSSPLLLPPTPLLRPTFVAPYFQW